MSRTIVEKDAPVDGVSVTGGTASQTKHSTARHFKKNRAVWQRRMQTARNTGPHQIIRTYSAAPAVWWTALAFVTLWINIAIFAVLMSVTALVATAQMIRSWMGTGKVLLVRPMLVVAGVLPIASLISPVLVLIAIGLFALLTVVIGLTNSDRNFDVQRSLAISLLVAGATSVPVLLYGRADLGQWATVSYIAFLAAYDLGYYIFSKESRSSLEAPAAGCAVVLTTCLLIATLMGTSHGVLTPWVMALSVCIGAPYGPKVVKRLIGPKHQVLSAVDRLDSALVVGPLFILTTTLVAAIR